MPESPLLSTIITSYNTDRLKDTFELLDSIRNQTYSHIETIFIAEGSRELYDQVKTYAREEDIPDTVVIFNEGERGASAARNLGIKQARGDIIAFIDDDALALPDWAEEMVASYADDSVIAVTGPAFPRWEDESMSWFPKEFYWIISCTAWGNWNGIADMRNVWTMNASFRREAFESGGLFSTSIGPQSGSMTGRKNDLSEDVELSLRVKEATGKRIIFNPKVRVQHRVYSERLKFSHIRQWSYWMGYSKHKLKKLYPQIDADPLKQERQLLGRIATGLLPNILKTFFTHPVIAWRRLRITATAIFFVAVGYCSHLLYYILLARKPLVHQS